MNETTLLVLLVTALVVAVIIGGAVLATRRARRRSVELHRHFGPEYDVAVEELGDAARAERELAQRERRVRHFKLRELSAAERRHFATSWNQLQAQFVDDPAISVTSANELINQLMRARGYPTESFEQRMADLSVGHPNVVQHYRAAHHLARSVHNGTVDTEELRQAVIHYRALFADLLQEGNEQPVPARHADAHAHAH